MFNKYGQIVRHDHEYDYDYTVPTRDSIAFVQSRLAKYNALRQRLSQAYLSAKNDAQRERIERYRAISWRWFVSFSLMFQAEICRIEG